MNKFKLTIKKIFKRNSKKLIISFSAFGMILSIFISNLGLYNYVRSDVLQENFLVTLTSDTVYNELKFISGDQLVTIVNLLSAPQINWHTDSLDYSVVTSCTPITSDPSFDERYIDVDSSGNVYVIDQNTSELLVYSYLNCTPTTYSIATTAQYIKFIESTGDILGVVGQDFVRYPFGDYSNPVSYNFGGSLYSTIDTAYNPDIGTFYAYSSNGLASIELSGFTTSNVTFDYVLSNPPDTTNCFDGIRINQGDIFIGCYDRIIRWDALVGFPIIALVEEFYISEYLSGHYLVDFTLDDNYIYPQATNGSIEYLEQINRSNLAVVQSIDYDISLISFKSLAFNSVGSLFGLSNIPPGEFSSAITELYQFTIESTPIVPVPCNLGANFSPAPPTILYAGDSVEILGAVTGNPNPDPFVYATGTISISITRDNGPTVITSFPVLDGIAEFQSGLLELPVADWYTVTVTYGGDTYYEPCSLTEPLRIEVLSTGEVDSETTIASIVPASQTQQAGEDVTFNIEVRDPADLLAILSGDVELRREDGMSYIVLDTATLDGSSNVSFTLNNLLPGIHQIYAQYLGGPGYNPSRSLSTAITIHTIQTFTSLTSNVNPVILGNQIELQAQVTLPDFTESISNPLTLNGFVDFKVGGTLLGTVAIDSFGFASLTVNTTNLPVGLNNLDLGTHHIRAYYYDHEFLTTSSALRWSNSETLFQVVQDTAPTGSSGVIDDPTAQDGSSDFQVQITGKDAATSSNLETKIGSSLNWLLEYNNLGPNSNGATVYFPIKENQEFVLGSIVAPQYWNIAYSQNSNCDAGTFTYTPGGINGTNDPLIKCIRFQSDFINSPSTRSDLKYITSQSSFTELNVTSIGGRDVYTLIPYGNKLYYFNHHEWNRKTNPEPRKTMFCFDLVINDTCVSNNPAIVFPVVLGFDGFSNYLDEFELTTSVIADGIIRADKIYIPVGNVVGVNNGAGFLCWDLILDIYCNGSGFNSQGFVSLATLYNQSWGYGQTYGIEYSSTQNEIYTLVPIGSNYTGLGCFSFNTNAPCVGQPYEFNTVLYFDPIVANLVYHPSAERIYTVSGNVYLDYYINCFDLNTKVRCTDFPAAGVRAAAGKEMFTPFILNDQFCVFSGSEPIMPAASPSNPPAIYCYDQNTQTFSELLPNMSTLENRYTPWDMKAPFYPDRLYFGNNFATDIVYCYIVSTGNQCPGWEGGKSGYPFDGGIYGVKYLYGCMWIASHTGRLFTFDPITGGECSPLFTLSQGNLAVSLDATNMFSGFNSADILWNRVKLLDTGTTPSPNILNVEVFDSANCTTLNNQVTCTGIPLKTGNLLLNSGHELDISDISYADHPALTAILEFEYPSIPSPAPALFIEINPTLNGQITAQTELVFNGALCSSPITSVCEEGSIFYSNDPVSSNNQDQYCLNVESYFGKDPNSDLCFVATTPQQTQFIVTNPNATVAPAGTPINFDPNVTYNQSSGSYSLGSGFFGFVENFVQTTFSQVFNEETFREVFKSFNTQTPLFISAITVATTSTIVITSVLSVGGRLGQILGIIFGFFVRKKPKYWGIVFDEETSKPLAFASITLSTKIIDKDGQLVDVVVAQAVSDLDGRYRLTTDKGSKLYLEVKASGFTPYTKFLSSLNPLGSLDDIVFDIPMQRVDSKVNFIKRFISYRKIELLNLSRFILFVSSCIGFVFTIYSIITAYDLLSVALLIVYIIIFLFALYPYMYYRLQKRGRVLDAGISVPVPGAVVRIYNKMQQIALGLTNKKGETRFNVDAGDYSVLASKRGYSMITPPKELLLKVTVKKEGYIDQNILMNRQKVQVQEEQQKEGILENPFA